MNNTNTSVALFATCLVDITRPEIGFAAVKLLKATNFNLAVPPQSCCAQPAYNNGNLTETKAIAKKTIETLECYDYIVVPSSSCAGMIKVHYPSLFKEDSQWQKRAINLSKRTYELITFLYQIAEFQPSQSPYQGKIYYHESCSSRREMKAEGALDLLKKQQGADVMELPNNEACCGFGGLFSVKFDEISNAMVSKKISTFSKSQQAMLTGLDLGCLANMAGKLRKEGYQIRVRHVAELLSGELMGNDI